MGEWLGMMVFVVMAVVVVAMVEQQCLAAETGIVGRVSMEAEDPTPMDRWQMNAIVAAVVAVAMV